MEIIELNRSTCLLGWGGRAEAAAAQSKQCGGGMIKRIAWANAQNAPHGPPESPSSHPVDPVRPVDPIRLPWIAKSAAMRAGKGQIRHILTRHAHEARVRQAAAAAREKNTAIFPRCVVGPPAAASIDSTGSNEPIEVKLSQPRGRCQSCHVEQNRIEQQQQQQQQEKDSMARSSPVNRAHRSISIDSDDRRLLGVAGIWSRCSLKRAHSLLLWW